VFDDRRDAGRRLAERLAPFAGERPIVVALPRGGVPVAVEVARALGAPLDLLAVRKLGAPGNPELAVGAVAEDGTGVLDGDMARRTGMTREILDRTLERESRELRRRTERYRDGRAAMDVRARTVIVVDDGLATGLTDLAAVRALRAAGASRIIVAAPVGSREAVARLFDQADEVVCHTVPRDLWGVGQWYRDFSPVEDAEVVALLTGAETVSREVVLDVAGATLRGDLVVPPRARGLVLFAHGSGSSRHSTRNRAVAATLQGAGLATLLFDLLSEDEGLRRELVFDVTTLAKRLEAVTGWARDEPATGSLPLGYFGASTGAAAALSAAADLTRAVSAIVSRGGRPDLAGDRLADVTAPTLLIVGGADTEVLELNRRSAALLRCPHRLAVVPGAGHLFAEPGALERVAELATDWFTTHLDTTAAPAAVGA
jgi:predicted phosphoribosyltransferase/predicted alpha/beta-hydrolase family hydrolase